MNNQTTYRFRKSESRFFRGYIIVIASFFIMAIMYGAYNTFGIFFKPVLTDFGWTRAMTSGAFSLAMIIYGLLGIAMGGLTDRLGPRIVLTLCGILSGLGYLLMSQISAVWQLYLFYGVIIGIAQGGAFIPQVSTVARWFVKRRSTMTGIASAGIGVGTLVMPPVANWLITDYGWRTSYLILGGVLLIIVVLAAQFLKGDPSQMGYKPYGGNEGEKTGVKLEAGGFSLRESARTRQFWLISGMALCFGLCLFAIMVHIAPHATELGFSTTTAASLVAIIGAMGIISRVALGTTADRIGNRQAFIISFILMAIPLLWLVPARAAWLLYLFAIVFGFGQGGIGVLLSPLLAEFFGLSSHGLIIGIVMFGFTLGGAAGTFMAGYLFDVTTSYQMAFLVFGIIAIIGTVLTVLLTPAGLDKQRTLGL